MKRKVVSGIMLTLLFIGMLTLAFNVQTVMVVGATPWDGVPDDPTPAQAMWVDPKYTTCFDMGDTFVVDVLINLTSPTSPGGIGLFGFEYKLKWNSMVLEAVEIQPHGDNIPSGDLLPGWTSVYVAANETFDATATEKYHLYAVSALSGNARARCFFLLVSQ